MSLIKFKRTSEGEVVEVDLSPQQILYQPLLNKGTGFTFKERKELGLLGLLPAHESSIEEQALRRYDNFCGLKSDLAKYRFLTALQDRNETLYFYFLQKHAEEMLPYIYTPTVGSASQKYSYIYNQNRGIYISYQHRDELEQIVANIPKNEVDVIVVTDGGRILGLGDLGVGGMAIPVGKLALYTLFGGIHPSRVLPIHLDVGTSNPELLEDPLYLGWRHERIDGEEYDAFLDRFVKAIKKCYPDVLLQWEDFPKAHAYSLLKRYRDEICSFNDDIQGTASVVLAAVLGALRATGQKLKEQRIVIFGGGSAGLGIARTLLEEMKLQGIQEDEALTKFYIVDRYGLIHHDLKQIEPLQKRFAQNSYALTDWKVEDPEMIRLGEVVRHVKPTILIGVSAQPGAFTKEIVKEMAKHVEKPIIFPLSNPTDRAEAIPHDIYHWTHGKAIVATGSPFPHVTYKGKDVIVGQCNNLYIFAGLGLGIIASKAVKVTDEMFLKAAETLSKESPILKDPQDSLFPYVEDLRKVSRKIGIEVAKIAKEKGLATRELPDVIKAIDETMWEPNYPLIRKLKGSS